MNTLTNFFKRNYFYILPLLLTAAIYSLLFGIYLVNNIDNPWSSAWIYNFFNHHITYDLVFYDGATDYWGVRFFSHIYCYLYGSILSVTGFTLHHIQLISHGLIFCGLVSWYLAAKTILKDQKIAFMFVILLALSGPVLNAANEARSDAFVFFLIGLSFLLWLRQCHFLSLIVAFVAVETHPIGGLVFFYLFAWFICYDKKLLLNSGFWLKCIGGIACGVGLYLFFHYSEISQLQQIFGKARDAKVNNFMYAFFYRDHKLQYREDVIVFLSAFVIYGLNYKNKAFYFLLSAVMLIASSLVFTRANSHYVLFVYPALWMLTVYVYSGLRFKYVRLEYLFVIFLVMDTNHYIHVAKRHWQARQFDEYITEVKTLSFPAQSFIYGNPIDYFAFYQYTNYRSLTSSNRRDHYYLLENVGTVFADDKVAFDYSRSKYTKIKTLEIASGGRVNVYEVNNE